MYRSVAIAGILAAGAAQALTPIPECLPEGAEAAAGVTAYSTAWHGGGFVLYSVWTDHPKLYLDDCRGGRRLTMTPIRTGSAEAIAAREQALFETVDAAVRAPEPYTMAQIGKVARKAGARTSLADARYESCACALFGAQN